MKFDPILLAALAFFSMSSIHSQDLDLLGSDFTVDYEAEAESFFINQAGDSDNYTDLSLTLTARWRDKIKLVLETKLTTIFTENNIELEDDFNLEEFINEAYIEIKDVGGAPVAIIVGKTSIPFLEPVEAMPVFDNNPLEDQFDKGDIFGLTVRLEQGLFGIFDTAEISAFELEEDDLQIGSLEGVAVRLTKQLTDNIFVNASYARMADESRTSIGLIGESDDGNLVGWIDGMVFSNNPEFPNSDFALTAGVSRHLTEATDVVVEMTYVQRELRQYAIGTNTALTRNISVGVELRYNDYVDDRDDELVFGVRATYVLASDEEDLNDEYLFN